MLAVVIGYYVIGKVHHALHTPLMSVTNAISGIIIVGALLQIGQGNLLVTILAFVATLLAAINIFGGFASPAACSACSRRSPTDEPAPAPWRAGRAEPMTATAAAQAAYIVAGLLFIMSLAGLSKHETARPGIVYGIAGMAIALAATVGLASQSISAAGATLRRHGPGHRRRHRPVAGPQRSR